MTRTLSTAFASCGEPWPTGHLRAPPLPHMKPFLLVENATTAELIASVEADLAAHKAATGVTPAEVAVQLGGFEVHTKFGQPTYRGLFKAALERFPDAPAVMFSNVDMLYTPSLYRTIEAAMSFVEADKRRQFAAFEGKGLNASEHFKVKGWMVYGQRVGMAVPPQWTVVNNTQWEEDMELRMAYQAKFFVPLAIDYFIVSRNLFDWSQVPDFVVGGIRFDNWLVGLGNRMARDGAAVTIGATNTILALHQNHAERIGVSGEHPKSRYNLQLSNTLGVFLGSTTDGLLSTELLADGTVRVFNRFAMV